jgi:hypothetical protein
MSRKNDEDLFSKEVEEKEESKDPPQYIPWSNPTEVCKKKNATLYYEEKKEEIKAANPPGQAPWSKLNEFWARNEDNNNTAEDLDINNEIDIENQQASGGGLVVSTSNDLDDSPGAAALGNLINNHDVPEETSNPRTPEPVSPGAFRVAGLNHEAEDDELTITIGELGISAEAELVDAEEEEKRLDDKINQALKRERQLVQDQIDQALQRGGQQGVVGVVLPEPGVISNRGKRWKLVGAFSILTLILIVVAVVLGIMLRPGDKTSTPTSAPTQATTTLEPPQAPTTSAPTQAPTTSAPTQAPTTLEPTQAPTTSAPTQAPTISALAFTELLSNASSDGGEALRNSSTQQAAAMEWLAGNENLSNYSAQQKIQRYALATLFYTTSGNNWSSSGLWLDDGEECGRWYGLECTSAGAVRRIALSSYNLRGTIPPEIGMFSDSLGELIIEAKNTTFHHLNLTYCCCFINYCTEKLELNTNALDGIIPTEVGQLNQLSEYIRDCWHDALHSVTLGVPPYSPRDSNCSFSLFVQIV